MKLTKVTINSVMIKDDSSGSDPKKVIKWEYPVTDDEIGEVEILLSKSVEDLVELFNGQEVTIEAGWTTSTDKRYFFGFITSIVPEGATYKVLAKNKMSALVRKNVNHNYDSSIDASAGEVSEIVKDLGETYGGMNFTVQSSGTEDGKRIDQFKCINADIFERVQSLKKALGWTLFYDDNTDVGFFQPLGFIDSGITLTVGKEIVTLPDWDWDDSQMINDLRIDGAITQTDITESGKIGTTSGYTTTGITLAKTPDIVELYMDASDPPTTQKIGGTKDASAGHFYYIDRENKKIKPKKDTTFTNNHFSIINYVWSAPAPIHLVNQQSIDDFGIYEKAIALSDVTSIADAESRGANILAKRSIPFINGKILVRNKEANIPNFGETVDIVDRRSPKVNGVYPTGTYSVNQITYKYPSGTIEIEVGDKFWRLVDWQQSQEERLRRIEERFIRNQDLVVELREMSFNVGVKPRYRKILTREYDVSELGFLLGHSTYGILGTNKFRTYSTGFETQVLSVMQQFQELYTENFIDDDFEDDSGTATWGNI